MSPLLPPPRPSKVERLHRLASRFPDWQIDLPGTEIYMRLVTLAADLWAEAGLLLAQHGLGDGRFNVLVLLLEHQPEPLSHSQLAELSCVTKGSITGLVDGLEHDRLVQRDDSGEDRRVRLISLTPAGLELVARVLPDHLRRVARLTDGLAPAEGATLLALLAKLQAGRTGSCCE